PALKEPEHLRWVHAFEPLGLGHGLLCIPRTSVLKNCWRTTPSRPHSNGRGTTAGRARLMAGGSLNIVLRHLRRLAATSGAEELTDRRLLQRFAAQKDEAAFAELVRRHGPLVLGVCRRVLRHEHDAEDVFQATFLVLARKAATTRWDDWVGHYLYE